jgi:hypothetical protein
MYRQKNRLLFVLLISLLLCSSAQANVLQISVVDSISNSSISQAIIFLNGVNFTRTDSNGQVFITHPGLNDQLIRVSMPGFEDWEKLVDKNETFVLVNLSRKTPILKINLYDSDSLGFVAGARVNISSGNSMQTNLTDVTGSVTFDVNTTTRYTIDISAQNYQPRSANIDINYENLEAQYWLLSSYRFSFVVKDKNGITAVPDAELRLNTVLLGKTDARGVLTISVPRGKVYDIDIKKAGYQTLTESRMINETDAFYLIALTKAPLVVSVSVFDENQVPVNGTQIYINGTLSGTTDQLGHSTFPNLVTGPYTLEIRKKGYLTVNRTIFLINKSEDYRFQIPWELADLTIYVQEKDQKLISDATIIINGNTTGVTNDHGQLTTRVKFDTLYNITAIKDSHQSSSVQTQVLEGNTSDSVTLIMEKSPDWGFIILIVGGAFGVLVLLGAIRIWGGSKSKRKSVVRKNEL